MGRWYRPGDSPEWKPHGEHREDMQMWWHLILYADQVFAVVVMECGCHAAMRASGHLPSTPSFWRPDG